MASIGVKMNPLAAGAMSGFVVALLVVPIGPIVLLVLAREPPSLYRMVLARVNPVALMIGLVILAYPTWTLAGVGVGLLYGVVEATVPGGGLGSPNLVYTVGISLTVACLAVSVSLLLTRAAIWLLILSAITMGVFGWALPHLAAI